MTKEVYDKLLEEYILKWENHPKFIKIGLSPEYVFERYHFDIKPYLEIITEFKIKSPSIRDKDLRSLLHITTNVWRLAKLSFKEFKLALSSKKSLMEFKAQLTLLKGLENTNYKNAKMVEMFGLRYDENWKTKNDRDEVELPKTFEVTIKNAKLSDEERNDKAQVKEE
jgi:hypothetical protein